VSHSAIVLLPLTPAPFADCGYLDRCIRALTSDGCSSCRFSLASCRAEGCNDDSGSHLNFVAITWSEASR
jgi:hypothetical protein